MDTAMLVSLVVLSAFVSVIAIFVALYIRDRVLQYLDRHANEIAMGHFAHELRFYKEAAKHGEHGTLLVDSPKYGLRGKVISFVFVGEAEPPSLTPLLLEYIWQEAMTYGFVTKEIRTYGALKEIDVPAKEITAPKSISDELVRLHVKAG